MSVSRLVLSTALAGLLALPFACSTKSNGAPPTKESDVSFETVRGIGSQSMTASQEVVRSAEEWTEMAQRLHLSDAESIPEIDWENEMLIAVFMGMHTSGGFSIQVERIEAEDGELKVVHVRERHPAPGDAVTMSITHPAHVVRLAKLGGTAVFRTE